MTKPRMPKIDADGESPMTSDGERLDGVQIVGAVTSVENHPGAGVLNKKKTNASNSTVTELSREKWLTETRF